jgi:lysophospholipase L1-like esterase
MVELARANGIKVILAAVLPSTKFEWNRALGDRSDMIIDLNERIHAFADAASIPYVDYHAAMRNDRNGMDPDLAEDGVHPTPKGFGIMQNLVLPVIERILEE